MSAERSLCHGHSAMIGGAGRVRRWAWEGGLPGAKHGHMSCFSHTDKNQKVNKNQVSFPVVFFFLCTLLSFGNLKKNERDTKRHAVNVAALSSKPQAGAPAQQTQLERAGEQPQPCLQGPDPRNLLQAILRKATGWKVSLVQGQLCFQGEGCHLTGL